MSLRDISERRFTKADILYFLAFLLIFLWIFRELFFTGSVLYSRDTTLVEIPARKLTLQLLKEGDFALWTDAYGNGQPFLANPKNAVLYPSTWIYLVLPFFWAFKLHYLVHAMLGWLGLYFLCKAYGLSRKSAFLGASLFSFSGMYLSSFEFYNHIAALAWMPWILLCLNPRGRPPLKQIAGGSALWALMILAGAPEIFFVTALLAAGQAILIQRPRKGYFVTLMASLLLAGLLAAPQLLPSFELLARTERSEQAALWPLDPIQLVNLPFPGILGDDRAPGRADYWGSHLLDRGYPLYYSLYLGFAALALFILSARRPWDDRKRYLILSLLLFLLVAAGRYSPLFFLYRSVPIISSIRYPVKFLIGGIFCLSILAAMGFESVTGIQKPLKKSLLVLVVTALASQILFEAARPSVVKLLNGLFFIEEQSSMKALEMSIRTGIFILVVTSMLLVLLRHKRAVRLAGWALLAMAVLDPAIHNKWINPTAPRKFFDRPSILSQFSIPVTIYRGEDDGSEIQKMLVDRKGLLRFYRGSLAPYTGIGDGVRYVFDRDFYAVYPAEQHKLDKVFRNLPATGKLNVLISLGCPAWISGVPIPLDEAEGKQADGHPYHFLRLPAGSRKPVIVYETVCAADEQEALKTLSDPAFNSRKIAILTSETALNTGSAKNLSYSLNVIDEAQGHGRYLISHDAEGIALFPGNYAPGWKAWLDGNRTECFTASLFSKGVIVPAGRHEIKLCYQPRIYTIGLIIGMIAWAAVMAVLIWKEKGRRASLPAALWNR